MQNQPDHFGIINAGTTILRLTGPAGLQTGYVLCVAPLGDVCAVHFNGASFTTVPGGGQFQSDVHLTAGDWIDLTPTAGATVAYWFSRVV